MKPNSMLHWLSCVIMSLCVFPVHAYDTDIYNTPPGSAIAPNILFILDNTANWDRASQMWVGSSKQGIAELLAIKNFVSGLTQPANVGLMMYTPNGNRGGYLRYGIRDMTVSANVTALSNILNGIDVTSSAEKLSVTTSGAPIAASLYETWLYLNGAASWAGMDSNADYSGNRNTERDINNNMSSLTTYGQGLTAGFAYKSGSTNAAYNSPLGVNCAKTFVIYIGNNGPNAQTDSPASTAPASTTLAAYNYTSLPDVQSAWTRFLHLRPDLTAGSVAATTGSVTTYTIDAYNVQQTASYTTVLQNMARNGGGKYFQAGSDAALAAALQNILAQIQAVNSVFGAATLPVSTTNRGVNLNQIYLPVFRPDGSAAPNWAGNLKLYQVGYNATTQTPFLADANGLDAQNSVTGFINPSAVSFWTTPSTFWDPLYYVNSQGVGGSSDSPDGDLVEKGGQGQILRNSFATSLSARKLYTCTGTCTSGSLLSSTKFDTGNTAITTAVLGASSSTERDAIINWVRGANVNLDDPANSSAPSTNVRGFVHGDVVHSRPAVINYNRTSDDVVVFYGANDGILHAVKGGQNTANGDGSELWGFIASEHFPLLKRQRDHSPVISATNPKPYFVDGNITVYTKATVNDGKIDYTRGDLAYIFVTMRRGGRFMYAIDVSNPAAPKLLWKRSNTDSGFAEMGQTWSDAIVATVPYQANPVLILGLGYDPTAEDTLVQGTATQGRGVMVLDATTGSPIWQAGPVALGATYSKVVSGMTYDIPASVSAIDSNGDGKVDRIYAVDTGANIWRINVNDTNPANWTVTKLASLGGTGVSARKFLFPPEVVPPSGTNTYDAVLLGSGDREHPFDTTIVNQFYMVKDDHGLLSVRATPIIVGTAGSTTGVSGQLYDATADLVQVGTTAQQGAAQIALSTASGWYITLATGEKVVGGSSVLAGTVFFGTNAPSASVSGSCSANLGTARFYQLTYTNAGAVVSQSNYVTPNLTLADRSQVIAGGGLLPTPITFSIKLLNGGTVQGVSTGPNLFSPPGPKLGRRYRTYWQRLID